MIGGDPNGHGGKDWLDFNIVYVKGLKAGERIFDVASAYRLGILFFKVYNVTIQYEDLV